MLNLKELKCMSTFFSYFFNHALTKPFVCLTTGHVVKTITIKSGISHPVFSHLVYF